MNYGNVFKNEISPYLYNIRGAVAMANAGADTNGSQFFINQNTDDQSQKLSSSSYPEPIIGAYAKGGNPGLDGNYTVFGQVIRSEEHTSELQSRFDLVCRLLLEKK